MEKSLEARALRRSNAVFKRGVDPDTLVTTLYSNELLTPDEKAKATHSALTDQQQLEELFTSLERRVNTNPHNFHEIVEALRTEPAMEKVADKMQDIYDKLKSEAKSEVSSTSSSSTKASSSSSTTAEQRGMQIPKQQELIDNVKITEWQRFALELKIDDRTVTQIERDTALPRIQDKLREVFRILLNEMDEDLTWTAVVDALNVIKEKRLARDIEKMFCQ